MTAMHSIEERRQKIAAATSSAKKSELGQFMTSASIAKFMSNLFTKPSSQHINLLDAGAGIGSLTAAFINNLNKNAQCSINVTVWEIDEKMIPHLEETLCSLQGECGSSELRLNFAINASDFIHDAAKSVFSNKKKLFTHAILNPPYKKIGAKTPHRLALREANIETGNLYSAFVALALELLEEGGELVAITPRSFCNGTYFRPFRKQLLCSAAITHAHIFESRTKVFKNDDVLQENVIFKLKKGAAQADVIVSTSSDDSFSDYRERKVPFKEVVLPKDKEALIHLVPDDDIEARKHMARFSNTLEDLGISVATGAVVDFRMREHLSDKKLADSVPLVYPFNFENGFISHPKEGLKKPNWISANTETFKWLMPNGFYTVVRRLSSKEEKRRLTCAVFDPSSAPFEKIGFENKLNVFHMNKLGLEPDLAKGLAIWLGSTIADNWFRRFNGHTQVNAGDLKALGYPDICTLMKWGQKVGSTLPSQEEIDNLVTEHGVN